MYIEVNFCKFQDAFYHSERKDQFSYEALRALFDYLESLEEDQAEPIKVDDVDLCCEYCEVEEDDQYYSDYEEGGEHEDQVIARLSNSVLIYNH